MKFPAFSKISLRSLRKSVFTLLLLVASFAGGYLVAVNGYRASISGNDVTISREVPQDKADLDFSLFWRVWDVLETSYFDKDKLDVREMVYGAIRGMVSSVGDPYTVFLAPLENKVIQEDLQGTFEGVGIQIGFKGTRLAVIAPLPDSPAEAAGIRAGDLIVGIKDEAKGIDRGTSDITLPEAVEAIRGPAGSSVTLTLLREGSQDPFEVDVVRESIDVPSIILTFVGEEENVAHIKLLKFSAETLDEWDESVRDILKKSNVEGIIVDVRNNPGGFLQQSVDIASEFLESGEVVVVEEMANGDKTEFKVSRFGRFQNAPLVVLVNGGSASASEILAGALRDQRGTTLVGEPTFGKGTIQEPRQLENGAGLHITTARWLTPSGYWVDEQGLEPDIILEDDPETSGDEQLQKAIDELLSL
jgi:carboxyl-terminal processing protease